MYDYKKLRDRYLNDAEFYAVVKALENFIIGHGVNPQELREAVFFACLKYQQEHVEPIMFNGQMFTFKDATE